MRTPFGTFIVYGPDVAPSVHLLSASEVESHYRRDSLAYTRNGRLQAMFLSFRVTGAENALPAWSIECMEAFALTYEGPHQNALRAVCAAAALGKLWGADGGEKAPLVAPKPRKPGPAKVSAFDQLLQGAAS